MCERTAGRFEVVVEDRPSRGGLHELEQITHYRVVDRHSDRVVAVFESLLEASLSTSTGLWDDYRFGGVCEVSTAPDERAVIVRYHDGSVETVALPE